MATTPTPELVVGLPWQLAESILQAASIPYTATFGNNYETHFSISDTGAYVGRVRRSQTSPESWDIVLYRPMVDSAFRECLEVQYAEDIQKISNA